MIQATLAPLLGLRFPLPRLSLGHWRPEGVVHRRRWWVSLVRRIRHFVSDRDPYYRVRIGLSLFRVRVDIRVIIVAGA